MNKHEFIRHLPEVGTPLMRRADELDAMLQAIEEAKQRYLQALTAVELELSEDWSADEIKAAKRQAQN